ILTGSKLIAAFGDQERAVVMYDTDTAPVNDAPGAECVTVRDGKITNMRIIFDRLPFEEARRAARTQRSPPIRDADCRSAACASAGRLAPSAPPTPRGSFPGDDGTVSDRSPGLLAGLLDDLVAETEVLTGMLAPLAGPAWERPT